MKTIQYMDSFNHAPSKLTKLIPFRMKKSVMDFFWIEPAYQSLILEILELYECIFLFCYIIEYTRIEQQPTHVRHTFVLPTRITKVVNFK